ncbi:MAG: ATP-dependent helicase HrpA [uncultured bacterium (gcode 4)]|uniref:ATP-dependent helicase HrpA n=1 Tax=uncultured bacterium (gcode 4) TaxID=1234023 RepID=K2G232_9BACT|nr:MAG: ATP-dependent helicase HrpA [uncultured bacterium (gcode 4)]
MHYIPSPHQNWDVLDRNWIIIPENERHKILQTVSELPVNWYIQEIIEKVAENVVTIISAETGSGKTTQVPKMLMWDYRLHPKHLRPRQIVVAEPRVIAAISAANRVSQEKLSETWDSIYSIWHKIWYRTGREVLSSKQSDLIFVTDWLQLLRQYVTNIIPDILVIDEVHTFSVATEFLLSQIRDTLLTTNKKVKLVLMSATMDVERVKAFFAPVSKEIPVFDIPWRTFPVNSNYLWRDDFYPSIMNFAQQEKNILVFVEWKKTIEETITKLKKELPNYNIYPLHSELAIVDQNKVMKKQDDKPVIIVATNVAQESITIDYINAVVDNGYCKVMVYNDRWVPELHTEPVSKADSRQRAWRAWRVMEWDYVRACDVDFEAIPDFPKWEIENITLEKNILIALSMWFNPLRHLKAWRNTFVHKPDITLLKITYDNLFKIWAITRDHHVTKLGNELLNMPLEPSVGKMLKESISRKCIGDMIDICAIINHKWFLSRWQDWKYLIKWTYKQDSDLIAQRELLKLLTRREPLDQELLWKLKSKNYWLSHHELHLFQEFAHHWKEKMLFEVVDFTSIWVKQKRIYEILNTIKTLTERLQESGCAIEFNEDEIKRLEEAWKLAKNQSRYENITKSILAWMLSNIFVYNKKTKKLFNEKKWWFVATDTSSIPLSEKVFYCGSPFILKWSKEDEKGAEDESAKREDDMYLLSFITKIDAQQIEEMGKTHIETSYSDIEVTTKVVWKTKKWWNKVEPTMFVNLQRELGWVTLPNIKKEIQKEALKEFSAKEWIAVILIENNPDFITYINSFKGAKTKFNIERFRSVIWLFTQNLQHRIYLDKVEETIAWFAQDREIFKSYMRSTIPAVVDFRKNPLKVNYDNPLPKPEVEFVEPQPASVKPEKQAHRPHSADIATWKVNIIDYLRKTSKYAKNKIIYFLENWVVTDNGKKLTEDSYIDPETADIEIAFIELRVISAIEREEKIKWGPLSDTETDQIRFDIESKHQIQIKKKERSSVKPKKVKPKKESANPAPVSPAKPVKKVKENLPKTSLRHTWEKTSRKRKKVENWEESIQLHKYLSQTNILTTILSKKYMALWAIKVNGEIAKLWMEINPGKDKIDIDHDKFKEEDRKERERRKVADSE